MLFRYNIYIYMFCTCVLKLTGIRYHHLNPTGFCSSMFLPSGSFARSPPSRPTWALWFVPLVHDKQKLIWHSEQPVGEPHMAQLEKNIFKSIEILAPPPKLPVSGQHCGTMVVSNPVVQPVFLVAVFWRVGERMTIGIHTWNKDKLVRPWCLQESSSQEGGLQLQWGGIVGIHAARADHRNPEKITERGEYDRLLWLGTTHSYFCAG